MSILNRASDGQQSVLAVLVRTAVKLGARSRDDLLDACGRGVAAIDGKALNDTLNRWTELGLFKSEENLVDLAEPHRARLGKKPDVAEAALPSVALDIALFPENNLRFWDSTENRSADFSRALSWVLAQDIYSFDMATKAVQALEVDQIKDTSRQAFKNDTRWTGLQDWMQFFGFTRELGVLTVDPTDALRPSITAAFRSDAVVSAQTFFQRLATQVPVLDGGRYRLQVEEILSRSSWSPPPDGMISTSLSRALQRLAAEGLIAFDRKSDSDGVVTLTGQSGRRWREITHVLDLRKGKKA